MNIGVELQRAVVRRAAFLLVAVALAWLGFGGRAEAHDHTCGSSTNVTCDRGLAYAASRDMSNALAHCESVGVGAAGGYTAESGWTPVILGSHESAPTASPQYFVSQYGMRYSGNGATVSCDTDEFFFSGTCQARNASLGLNTIRWANSPDDQCIGGCKYRIVSDSQTRAVYASTPGQPATQTGTLYGGHWEYTGDICGAPEPVKPREEEKPKQTCSPAASGQTYCVTPQGQNCHTASTGRTICWQPGETGTKTDGTVTQTNNQGNAPPATLEGSTNISTTNVITTTSNSSSSFTINNYTTNSGAPASGLNQGSTTGADGGPADNGASSGSVTGSGTGTEGNGTCEQGPVNAAICASRDYLKKISDFFSGLGGEADGLDKGDGELKDADSIWTDAPQQNDLDSGGLGWGGSCPAPPTYMGHSLDAGGNMCLFASIIGALVLVAAYAQAAYIIGKS